MSNTGYGLPSADGPQEHSYEWGDREVTIELVPPTLDQVEEYQSLGEDADVSQMRDILQRHIKKPEKPPGEMTLQEVNCYVAGIMDHAESGGPEVVQEARAYLEEQAEAADEGNSVTSSE